MILCSCRAACRRNGSHTTSSRGPSGAARSSFTCSASQEAQGSPAPGPSVGCRGAKCLNHGFIVTIRGAQTLAEVGRDLVRAPLVDMLGLCETLERQYRVIGEHLTNHRATVPAYV